MKIFILLLSLFFYTGSCDSRNDKSTSPQLKESKSFTPAVARSSEKIELNNDNNTLKTQTSISHSVWNEILNDHVSKDGRVNYKGIKQEGNKLQEYISHLAQNTPSQNWTKNEILAYWINAYNALTIDLILRNYPVQSIKDIDDPWDQRLWKLGSKLYNLDEIEHEILRKMDEPRIHFAIVCASYSCPKLQNEAYVANRLEQQLTDATREFLSDSKRNFISEGTIEISKIFQWFAKDFKSEGSVIDFINRYTDISVSPNAKKRYKTYNWDLND